jgi:hypothetical protein
MTTQSKAVTAAWGYIAMGVLAAATVLPGVIDSYPDKMVSLGVFAAIGFLAFGCWSVLYGLSRLFLPAYDRQKWFEDFSRNEDKIRGGSRRTVIILGCIAIVTILGSSSFFLWFY